MIDPHAVPEIADAIVLFERYEKSPGDLSSVKHFAEAVQILNDYLEDEPNSPYRNFIQNIRISYTRSLLKKLSSVDRRNVTVWSEHVFLILVPLKSEAEALMIEYPDLEADFNAFLDVWKDDLVRALIEDEKKNKTKGDKNA